jgi:O-antigen/teichoic acid export membrane protein
LSQAVELLLLPVLTMLIIAGQDLEAQSIDAILKASLLAGVIVVALGVGLLLKDSVGDSIGLRVTQSNLFRTALPMWGVAISQNLGDWYGLVTLNQWSGPAETGIFRVSWQIATVLPIIALSLQATFAAQIASASHIGQRTEMARLCRTATSLSTLIFVPVAALVFIFAKEILSVFGPEFVSGATTLRILTVGQTVIAGFGIAGQVLVMAGHARLNLIIGLSTTVVTLLAAPFAATAAGGMGVALVFTGAYILKIGLFFAAVRKLEGFNAFTGRIHGTH